MMKHPNSRKTTEQDQKMMTLMDDAVHELYCAFVPLAEKEDFTPPVFIDLWLTVLAKQATGTIVSTCGLITSTEDEAAFKKLYLEHIKIYIESLMFRADDVFKLYMKRERAGE